MKRTLVLTLVLVMALASTAFAGVNLGGEFYYEVGQTKDDGTKVDIFQGTWNQNSNLRLDLRPTASGDGWSFDALVRTAGITNFGDGKAAVNASVEEYRLQLNDPNFTLNLWRRMWVGDKADPTNLLGTAGGWPHNEDRFRLEAPIMDLVKVTYDYEWQNRRMYTFVDYLEYPVGLVHYRKVDGDVKDTLAAYGTFDLDLATIKGTAGLTLAEGVDLKDKFGFAVQVDVPVTSELAAMAKYTHRTADFTGDTGRTINTALTYTVTNLQAQAKYDVTAADVTGDFDKGTVTGRVTYRQNTNLNWDRLFHNDDWFNVQGVAAEVVVTNQNEFTVDGRVSAQLVPGLAVARTTANYKQADKSWNANAIARIYATDRVTLFPEISFNSDKALTLKNVTEYKVGGVTLGFEVGQTTEDSTLTNQNAKFSVKVGF